MTVPAPRPEGDEQRAEPPRGWAQRRRDKVAAEIARNRRGEYTVPTWALTLVLVLIVLGWLALILIS